MKNPHVLSIVSLIIILSLLASCNQTSKSQQGSTSAIENWATFLDTSLIERFPINSSIRAIEAVDDQTLWFGGSRGMYGYTENGGKTWIIDSLKHPDHENMQFRAISVNPQSVFLLAVASPALLYKSNDKGRSWNIVYQEYDSLAFYDAMAFWDDQEGIAMGDPIDDCISIIITRNGGNSWIKIPCKDLPPVVEGEAAFAASNSNISLYGNNAWIVTGGERARVFHSNDRGKSWNVYDTPIMQGGQMTGIFSCDFYDNNTGVIIGGDWQNQDINTSNKAITRDGGRSWSLIADGQEPGYRSCVQYLSDESPHHMLAVGIPGISYSSDGGDNWTNISDEDYYTFRIFDNVLWLAGNNKIARILLQSRK